jgi:5-formyltetrahydrofolate cyclo-ligase
MDTDKHGLQKQKSELRLKIRARLGKISAAGREAASLQLCTKLKGQSFFQNAAAILFFAPIPDETDIWTLLEEALAAGKIAALPHFDADAQNYVARRVQNLQSEIVSAQFLVREPNSSCAEIPLDKIDLILVPSVAFDLHGNRLGRGKGFYDRLLSQFRGTKCGIAFDEQIENEIPTGAHDVRMNFILTPTRCLKIAD